MIWTKNQLISNLIKHIIKNDGQIYYAKDIGNDNFKVSYKHFKNATQIRTGLSYSYWMDNFVEYCNDGLIYDIEEYKDQNPDISDSELEKGIEQLEKEFDERTEDMDQFYDYLNNAITEIHLNPNEEIDA